MSWAALPVGPACIGKTCGGKRGVYPLIGAVLQKELRSVLSGNVNKSISRNMKIKATKYRNNYRVWLDYAGDYRNENIE